MTLLRQAVALSRSGIGTLPRRLSSSLVVVVGVATTVGILTALLALGDGLERTLKDGARPDQVLVLSRGAPSESKSSLTPGDVAVIEQESQIKRDDQSRQLASAEVLSAAELSRSRDSVTRRIIVRGVGPLRFKISPDIHIMSGRPFRPGVNELIAGNSAASQFRGLRPGARVDVDGTSFVVTGLFSAEGVLDNELLGDAQTILSAAGGTHFQSLILAMKSSVDLGDFQSALTDDPRLAVTAVREADYLENVGKSARRLTDFVAYFVGGITALGITYSVVTTMFSAIDARASEIGTFRAIGFVPLAVIFGVLSEAMLLCCAGAALGLAATYLLFNGHLVDTLSLRFPMRLTILSAAIGVIWALTIGLIGGIGPAWSAATRPISVVLRRR